MTLTSDNHAADPLGIEPLITDDTIAHLVGLKKSMLGKIETIRRDADSEIAELKNRAGQIQYLITVAEQRRAPSPTVITCVRCGRTGTWMPGYGYMHEVEGQQTRAGDDCTAVPAHQPPADQPLTTLERLERTGA